MSQPQNYKHGKVVYISYLLKQPYSYPGQNQGYDLAYLIIQPIYDLMEHMKGPDLQTPATGSPQHETTIVHPAGDVEKEGMEGVDRGETVAGLYLLYERIINKNGKRKKIKCVIV